MDRNTLKRMAHFHVIEATFIRRDKNRIPRVRRIFFTLDVMLLNSALGKRILKTYKVSHPPPYNAAAKNLLIVWDIIQLGWRSIPMESLKICHMVSTRPQKKFWEFFDAAIKNMSPADKSQFMDIP